MRYAILSDIHSNFEALYAVTRKIQTMKIDKIYCLGDIVGYNADPVMCIRWIKENTAAVIRGNHDKAVADVFQERRFNYYARDAIRWTRAALEKEDHRYLKNLMQGPFECEDGIILCHGTPFDEDAYVHSREVADECFDFLEDKIPASHVCFFGHTHLPVVIADNGNVSLADKPVLLEHHIRYLVNPGSVGQSRDGDLRASFGVYDTQKSVFELVRIKYNIAQAQQKILLKGLPEVLASRLSVGR